MKFLKRISRRLAPVPVIGLFIQAIRFVRKVYFWKQECYAGNRFLKSEHGKYFWPSNPLRIELMKIFEVHPAHLPSFFQYNPTIHLLENKLQIFWRITNWASNPSVTFSGDLRESGIQIPKQLQNGLARGGVKLKGG